MRRVIVIDITVDTVALHCSDRRYHPTVYRYMHVTVRQCVDSGYTDHDPTVCIIMSLYDYRCTECRVIDFTVGSSPTFTVAIDDRSDSVPV